MRGVALRLVSIVGFGLISAAVWLSSAQAGADPFLGEVQYLALDFCPATYLPADG